MCNVYVLCSQWYIILYNITAVILPTGSGLISGLWCIMTSATLGLNWPSEVVKRPINSAEPPIRGPISMEHMHSDTAN